MRLLGICIALFTSATLVYAQKIPIKAVAIPLADHYPAIVAYEKYKDQMQHANYTIKILPGPHLVRKYFRSHDEADIAFNVAPMVIDMFNKNPNFKWVSLIHRDGNALAINPLLNEKVLLGSERKPDTGVALALRVLKKRDKKPVEIAVPSMLSTHTTILYKYLKDNQLTMSLNDSNSDVNLQIIKPPNSIAYLQSQSIRRVPAAFEQSLPWAHLVEASENGYVAWYSKDVMQHDKGHVECIVIAKDDVIQKKRAALKEVIYFIHKAGIDIEIARTQGAEKFDTIIQMIRKHIPEHTISSIKESLNPKVMAINYKNLNVDTNAKTSLKQIMDLAYEAGLIEEKIDIELLADEGFATEITANSE